MEKRFRIESIGHSEHMGDLFPQLPNFLTLDRIVPKLAWSTFHNLAAVSRAWRKAISDHRACSTDTLVVHAHDYETILDHRACSTDTLVVHAHEYETGGHELDGGNRCHDYDRAGHKLDGEKRGAKRIAVYSVRDKICYDLPPIPGLVRGVPSSCAWVALDGKIYVLGGVIKVSACDKEKIFWRHRSATKVYVLDLAGANHWKQCARMLQGRQKFGCAVFDGKIYVFGGSDTLGSPHGAEVYDPKLNYWCPIVPDRYIWSTGPLRFSLKCAILKQEIFVHEGEIYDPCDLGWEKTARQAFDLLPEYPIFVKAYSPAKKKWTVHDSMGALPLDFVKTGSCLFVARGQFHYIEENNISVYEDDRSWTRLKENEFPNRAMRMAIQQVVHVESSNELIAGIVWYDEDDPSCTTESAICQSRGFGTENRKLIWNVVSRCPGLFDCLNCIQF